jgi:ketosteroid isomerase-like protein
MTTENIEAKARESIAAFDRADWDAIRALLAPDYVYEETGTGRRI